jgi:hypothetical protein
LTGIKPTPLDGAQNAPLTDRPRATSMPSMNKPDPAAVPAPDAPIANFSECHVGIVAHLDSLGELPALLAPAARARKIAADTLAFFDAVIIEHHAQEEKELFPAVLAGAVRGEEHTRAAVMVERLTAEHRQIEAWWSRIKPQLKQIAKAHDTPLDLVALQQLVGEYRSHAAFEEAEFLPLAQRVLGRNSNQMAALGMALHLRHRRPVVGYV